MNEDEYRKLEEVEDRMWYFRALHAHIERELVRVGSSRAARVLDAGCGTGGLILRLAPKYPGWTWAGIDYSPLACEAARRRVAALAQKTIEIRQASITRLPFPDASFDVAVSADVLCNVQDDEAGLRELCRVVRPGGSVVINVPAFRWLWSYHDVAVQSVRRYGRAEVTAKLKAGGAAAVRTTYWNTLFFPLIVARRKLLPPPKGGSDVHDFPGAVEAAFDWAMTAERRLIQRFGRLPFGTSVFAVAEVRQR